MRKSNAQTAVEVQVKEVLGRIEALAKKEFRDLVGQLNAMLAVYEDATGKTSKRPYKPRTQKETIQAEVTELVSSRPAFALTAPDSGKRKVRWDKGLKRGPRLTKTGRKAMSRKGRTNISEGMKLSWAKRKAQLANSTL